MNRARQLLTTAATAAAFAICGPLVAVETAGAAPVLGDDDPLRGLVAPASSSSADDGPDGSGDEAETADEDDPTTSYEESEDGESEDAEEIEISSIGAGGNRLRDLRRLIYVVVCPDAICDVGVTVRLRLPGGRTHTLESDVVSVEAGELTRLVVEVPRSLRRKLRKVALRGRSVAAVAHFEEWSTGTPRRGEALRMRLR